MKNAWFVVLATLILLLLVFALAGCEKEKAAEKPNAKTSPQPQPLKVVPVENEKDNQAWLDKYAKANKPEIESRRKVLPDSVGSWKACTPREKVAATAHMNNCPELEPGEEFHCYTPYKALKREQISLELWTDETQLVAVVMRSKKYRTEHGIGVGDPLARLRSTYTSTEVFRGEDKIWRARVPQLNLTCQLEDNQAETADKLDPFVKIKRMDISFKCPQ